MVEVDMTGLVRYREAEKEAFRSRHGVNLTYLPFVGQILCEALHEFPFLNSTWTDDGIILKKYVNLGLAVAVPPDGLIVPVVKDADRLGFTDLVRAIADLTERARSKHLKPEDVQSGTFTLNNTGATGSMASMPIINQPQAAILTTETIMRRPVVIGEGVQRAAHGVGDAVALLPADGAVGVADLDPVRQRKPEGRRPAGDDAAGECHR